MSYDKLYFWFSRKDKRLRYGDERLAKIGITHSVKGELQLCHNGLHASEKIIDALDLATGSYLWLVSLSDEKIVDKNKVCARSRTYRAEFNADKMIRNFTRKQALINVELIKPFCTPRQYDLTVEWLQAGRKELRLNAKKISHRITSLKELTKKPTLAYSAAYSICCTTVDKDLNIDRFLWAHSRAKGRLTLSNEDHAQANKMLMDMLPNRIKAILEQHKQGEQL
jgi:hypothetical protein